MFAYYLRYNNFILSSDCAKIQRLIDEMWSVFVFPRVASALDDEVLGEAQVQLKWSLLCELAWEIELPWWCLRCEFWKTQQREKLYEMVWDVAPGGKEDFVKDFVMQSERERFQLPNSPRSWMASSPVGSSFVPSEYHYSPVRPGPSMLEVTDSSDAPSVIVEEGSQASTSSDVESDIGSVAGSHRSGVEEVADEPRNQDTLQERNARHIQPPK